MRLIVYQILIQLAATIEWGGAFFNAKLRRRKKVLRQQFADQKQVVKADILFHCASLGEYLQARPLMEMIKGHVPNQTIAVSFFSASGYDRVKPDAVVTATYFLPIDSKRKMATFLDEIQPRVVVLVKYEIWLNLLSGCQSRSIPVYLISARFHPNDFYFKWYGADFLHAIKNMQQVFVQNDSSRKVLAKHAIDAQYSGDTRADQVQENLAVDAPELRWVGKWKGEKPLLLCGSAWPADWQHLGPAIQQVTSHYKIIIAPHEMDEQFMKQIEKDMPCPVARWTTLDEGEVATNVILLNTIGVLSKLYRFADAAFIGGAFNRGLHNIYEAAVWKIPVIFGPLHQRYPEGQMMIDEGGAFEVTDTKAITQILENFADEEVRRAAGMRAFDFVKQQAGGTQRIFNKMKADGCFIDIE